MSFRVVGGAGGNPALVASYSLPATITANQTRIPADIPLPAATKLPKLLVTNGKVTSSPDLPGISSISVKTLTTPDQVNALRSAAANTATAFSLPVRISADRATRLQNQNIQDALAIPPIVIDEVIIPD